MPVLFVIDPEVSGGSVAEARVEHRASYNFFRTGGREDEAAGVEELTADYAWQGRRWRGHLISRTRLMTLGPNGW